MLRQSNYGVLEIIKNIIYLIKTKLFFPGARLVRFPIVVRGKKYIKFGKSLTTGRQCRFDVIGSGSEPKLIFGNFVNVGDNVRISCLEKITIGNHVLIGSKVLILDNSHGNYQGDNQDTPYIPPDQRQLISEPITIEDNVWIGEGSVIQKGITIGFGSVIAANSVIVKDVPPKVIVGGVPAEVIKKYNDLSQCWENT